MMEIKELLGKRVLVTPKGSFRNARADEVKILEVSPSGNWVKLMGPHGNKYWMPVAEFTLIETLVEFKLDEHPKDD